MQILTPGANANLNQKQVKILIRTGSIPGADMDVSAFLVGTNGKVSSDDRMCFYGQPTVENGSVRLETAAQGVTTFSVDLDKVGADVERIVFSATIHDQKATFGRLPSVSIEFGSGAEAICGAIDCVGRTETALILGEIYRRNGAWKVKVVGQGFAGGLEALAPHFGVVISATPSPAPVPAPVPQPAKVSLTKVSGKVDLRKGQGPILIDKTPEIMATISWKSGTDYDVYALVMLRDGRQIDVATFSATGVPVLMNYQGAVVHTGDITRDSGTEKRETIRIRLSDDILAVVPVCYSAQSNGTGSFVRYKVSMAIDNGAGTRVTIPAENASNNDNIYTCVPGIILNTSDGIEIEPLEIYAAPGSELRPKLIKKSDGRVAVMMDKGPQNTYK